jgi:hyperosmotically inducible protein
MVGIGPAVGGELLMNKPNESRKGITHMKIQKLLALSLMTAAPVMLFANSQDSQIEDAAKASYNFHAVLNDHVKAHADNGVVTLTGRVEDRDQKALAEDTVRNLPGVVSVVDKIRVESEPAEHSDAWIALKIRSSLLFHANVSAADTKVDVSNGTVVLTGTVANAAQKDLTEAYAKDIDGVQSVNNELMIKENTSDSPSTVSSARVDMDDASITSEVKYALLSHRSTSALKTKVTTKDGVVMISGDASSDAEKDLVSKMASSIRGVRSVDNDMVVRTNQ